MQESGVTFFREVVSRSLPILNETGMRHVSLQGLDVLSVSKNFIRLCFEYCDFGRVMLNEPRIRPSGSANTKLAYLPPVGFLIASG